MEYIRIEQDGPVAIVTVDRQAKRNALNAQVQEEITEAFGSLARGEARAIVITGAGDKAFVAGADVGALGNMNALAVREFGRIGTRMMAAIEAAPMPVIAAVNGVALGGGVEIALACDIRIAAANARFGFPEVTLGIMPGAGGTQRLPRLIGSGLARELVFTGHIIDAREAQAIGLVNRVVDEDQALPTAIAMAQQIAKNAPIAVRHAKLALNAAEHADVTTGIEVEGNLFALLFATEDTREGLAAFAERRTPEFKGQ